MNGEQHLFATDPWGQDCMVVQSGQAGDFTMSMGVSEVQLPVHPGEATPALSRRTVMAKCSAVSQAGKKTKSVASK